MRILMGLGLVLGVVACQPLYGDPPERPHTPEPKVKPAEPPPPEPQYVTECTGHFTEEPKKFHPNPVLAQPFIDNGDTAIATSEKSTEPVARTTMVVTAIERYRSALVKDPYNADATLKLAVAYDKVLRKGCAIVMLKRLASLTNNPKLAPDANRSIQAIPINAGWFKGYRRDALDAVGL
ncbi:MAG TPA: hypothetical protein VGC41_12760 [Kofleriaceae bacterium]